MFGEGDRVIEISNITGAPYQSLPGGTVVRVLYDKVYLVSWDEQQRHEVMNEFSLAAEPEGWVAREFTFSINNEENN